MAQLFLFEILFPVIFAMLPWQALGAPSGEIVGGTEAQLGEFPYIVSILNSGYQICGGTLLNQRTVLTAAHCIHDFYAPSISVRAGSLNKRFGGVVAVASLLIIHPDYKPDTVDNDIGLIFLAEDINETSDDSIGYATLPLQGEDPQAGGKVTVAGWGLLAFNAEFGHPTYLQRVDVFAITRATCRAMYGLSAITGNMWCAGVSGGGKDACQGDSGGPAIEDGSGRVSGIVSWGIGCAFARYPGVYTRVGNYVDWIKQQNGIYGVLNGIIQEIGGIIAGPDPTNSLDREIPGPTGSPTPLRSRETSVALGSS